MGSKNNYVKYLLVCSIIFVGVGLQTSARGGVIDDAVSGMRSLLGSSSSGDTAVSTSPESNSKDTNRSSAEVSNISSGCGPESIFPVDVCEAGQGLLCLNTPSLSVSGEFVIVHGTVDKRSSIFSHLEAFVQNEYTKNIKRLEIKNIAEEDCWKNSWANANSACIDAKGFFGVKFPLDEVGPYTLKVDAFSLDGEAVSKIVRTSRVTAVKLSKDDIKIVPDPTLSGGKISATKIGLSVDLLHGCTSCDLIGTSTGGTMITVTNMIETPDGGMKTISRRGNISSGGKYDLCVPVSAGTNELTVSACNAATAIGNCPTVKGMKFEVTGGDARIDLISPERTKLLYESSEYPNVPLRFTIANYSHDGECKEGDVLIKWNRNAPVSLCPDANGIYAATLVPIVGINVGIIEAKQGESSITQSFEIGWGKIVNPYNQPGSGWLKNALGLHIGSGYINETVRPLVNTFLNSENLKKFIGRVLTPAKKGQTQETAEDALIAKKIAEIKNEIPYCSSKGDLGGIVIELAKDPAISMIDIERLTFGESSVGFKLDIEGLEIHLKLYRDDNKDGLPDKKILPIMVGIKGAQIDGRFEVLQTGKRVFLISSEHTNCDYQSASYCEKKPALLIPQKLVGGATKGGSFVRCDDKGQQLSAADEEGCMDLNITNAQTGLLNQRILDVINDALYCQGSAYLTYLLREKARDFTVGAEIASNRTIWLNGGIDLSDGKIDFSEDGIGFALPARFGGSKVLSALDSNVMKPDNGIITEPYPQEVELTSRDPNAISLSISTELINELLYQLSFQKEGSGILDMEIDETFFNKLGFDFVSKCDMFKPTPEIQAPPALCQLRPRVSELLGATLTTSGYFAGKQPLKIKFTGSRALAPRISVYRSEVPYELPLAPGEEEVRYEYRPANILELQVPDVNVAFYALEIDEAAEKDIHGNYILKSNADGSPIIHSMIPGSELPVPIIQVRVTIIVALEVGELSTLTEDPSQLYFTLMPIPSFAKIIFKKVEGGNATVVSDESLLSAFSEKVNYGIAIYGKPEKAIKIKLPKTISLKELVPANATSTDLFDMLGLDEISFGKDGLKFNIDTEHSKIDLSISPRIGN